MHSSLPQRSDDRIASLHPLASYRLAIFAPGCLSACLFAGRRAMKPDRFLSEVSRLAPAELAACGVRAVLLDVDNTIVARGTRHIASPARAWLAGLRQQGIRVCLLSNNWHKVVQDYAAELGLPIVYRAMKPLPFALIKAKRIVGAAARQTVVVGDQLLTDIAGGKLLGMRTVLVCPLTRRDLWHTLLLRRLERLLLGDLRTEDAKGTGLATHTAGDVWHAGAILKADQSAACAAGDMTSRITSDGAAVEKNAASGPAANVEKNAADGGGDRPAHELTAGRARETGDDLAGGDPR
jgi:HAD superfamily phosphatase (TIGR01668 family)